jgi:hypothetical protein
VGAPGRVCCVGSFQGQGNCVRGQGQEYCVMGQGQDYCVSGVLAVWKGSVSGWALGSGLWTLDSGPGLFNPRTRAHIVCRKSEHADRK